MVDNFEQLLDAARRGRRACSPPRRSRRSWSPAARRCGSAPSTSWRSAPLAREPAAALFIRRARAVDPRLQLEAATSEIEQICARLDGLPLAIELAAARIKVLTPAEILERLARRLDLLSAGPRDAPVRQQTLRAAIGWSYDLLDAGRARLLFSRLGVFAGGFTLGGRRGGVRAGGARRHRRARRPEPAHARPRRRFGMLETVREYALERLTRPARSTRCATATRARSPT